MQMCHCIADFRLMPLLLCWSFPNCTLSCSYNLSKIQSTVFVTYLNPIGSSNTSSFYDLYKCGKSLHIDNITRLLKQMPLLLIPNHVQDRKYCMVVIVVMHTRSLSHYALKHNSDPIVKHHCEQ